ncbi:MAG: molybdenum cofactor guanylyltransferase [Anaerolineales bacterium]
MIRSHSLSMGKAPKIGVIGLSVAIQAGGESTRMGADKALLPFQGGTMIEHILRQVEGLGDEIFIITNRPENYRRFGLPTFMDVIPNWGALGGLYSALYHSPQEYCLILACDMPFINRPLLEHIISLSPEYDAVVPRLSPRFIEPFRAVYRKTCLPPIEAVIDAGQRRVISFFDQVNIRFVERAEIEQLDPECRSFFNVNTIEDLAKAGEMATGIFRVRA